MWAQLTGGVACLTSDCRFWTREDVRRAVTNLYARGARELLLANFLLPLERRQLTPDSNPPPPHPVRQIITLWYRPLEVLLGGRHYTTAVRVASVRARFVPTGRDPGP